MDIKYLFVTLFVLCALLVAVGPVYADDVGKCADCVENATVNSTVSPSSPFLTITKQNESTTIIEKGGQIKWRLNISNIGNRTAYNVKVIDMLPDGLRYTADSMIVSGNDILISGSGQYGGPFVENDGKTIRWTFNSLLRGASGYITFNTTAVGTLSCADNNATINGTYSQEGDCRAFKEGEANECYWNWIGSSGETDIGSNSWDGTAWNSSGRIGNQTTSYKETIGNVCINVTNTTSITVTKLASGDKDYEVCEDINYNITVTQTGNANLPINIQDLFPSPSCIFVNTVPVNYSQNVTACPNCVNSTIITGYFNGTEISSCTNTVNVNGTSTLSPFLYVTATNTETVTIRYPTLTIAKEVLSSSSSRTQYKITVRNTGTGIARNITLNDTMSYDPSNDGWKIDGSNITFSGCLNNSNLAACDNSSCWGSDQNRVDSTRTYNQFNFTINGSTTCTITYWTNDLAYGSSVYNTRANTVTIVKAYDNCSRFLSEANGVNQSVTSVIATTPEHNLIRVNKTANATTVQAGDIIKYTIKVTNFGSVSLKELKFESDTLPQGFEYNITSNCTNGALGNFSNLNMRGDGGETSNNATGIIDDTETGRLVPDETITCWYTVKVKCDATEGAQINRIKLNGKVTGTSGNKVYGEDAVAVYVLKPKLIIEKYMSTSTVSPGQTVVAQVIVTNIGNGIAYNVNVTDAIIYGTGMTSANTSAQYSATLAAGSKFSVTYNITAAQNTIEPALYIDRATVTYDDKNSMGCEAQTPNVSDDAYLFVISNTAMLVEKNLVNITMANGTTRTLPGPAIRGDMVKFNITINNTGHSTDNLTITSIYDWMTDQNWDDGINCTDNCAANTNILGGGHYSCIVTCTVNKSAIDGLHCNKVQVKSHSDDGTQFKETDMACFVVGRPDVTFTKEINRDTQHPERNVTYTIWVENLGSAMASQIKIFDQLPESFRYINDSLTNCTSVTPVMSGDLSVSASPSGDTSPANSNARFTTTNNTQEFTINNMPKYSKCYFKFDAYILENATEGSHTNTIWGNFTDQNGNYYNVINITGGNVYVTTDMTLFVNKSMVGVVNATGALLNNGKFVQPGDYFNFTIEIHNNGTNTLHNIAVTDTVPLGISIVSTSNTCRDHATNSMTCTINNNAPDDYTPDSINCSATGVDIGSCFIHITAYVNTTNTTNISADAKVPLEGEQCNKVVVTGGKYNNATGTWKQLRETDSACFIVGKPHLTIEKYVEGDATKVSGDTVEYHIIVRNTGTANATNITIRDSRAVSGSGWTIGPVTTIGCGSNTVYKCSFSSCSVGETSMLYFAIGNPSQNDPNFGDLAPGAECHFAYNLSIPNNLAQGLYENNATVAGIDYDYSQLQKSSDAAYVMVVQAGPMMRKEMSRSNAEPNDTIGITLYVDNYGITPLTAVRVNDTLPVGWNMEGSATLTYQGGIQSCNDEGMTLSEATTITCTHNQTSSIVNCSSFVLCDTHGAFIRFTVRVNDSAVDGANTNYANLWANDAHNNTYSSNITHTILIVNPTNNTNKRIQIVKAASKYEVEPGDNLTFTLYIMNPSGATLYNARIYDVMSKGFDYISGTSTWNGGTISNPSESINSGDVASQTLNWNVTTLMPYSVNILTYVARVGCNISIANSNYANVTVTTATGQTNMSDSTNISISGGHSNVSITKYASNYRPSYFDYVDYTIVIRHNTTWAHVQGLDLSDALPTGLKYVSGSLRIGDIKIYGTNNESNGSQIMSLYDCPSKAAYDALSSNCRVVGNISGTSTSAAGTTINISLFGYVFLSAWEQIKISYTAQVRPNVGSSPQNTVIMHYLDPAYPEVDNELSAQAAILVPPSVSSQPEAAGEVTTIALGDDSVATINLNAGWNLIAISVMPNDKNIDSVLSSISEKCDAVYKYDNGWIYNVKMNGQKIGDLKTIEPGNGYWVHVTEPTTLSVSGKKVLSMDVSLNKGWNLIGYSVQNSKPVSDFNNVYTDIFGFDNGRWTYSSYVYKGWSGDLTALGKNKAYWIKAKEATTIVF